MQAHPFDHVDLVLVDVDNTILRFDPGLDDTIIRLSQQLAGLTLSEDALKKGYRAAFAYWGDVEQARRDAQNGHPAHARIYVHNLLVAMAFPPERLADTVEQISSHLLGQYRPGTYLTPGTKELLEFLHASGKTVGLVSNRDGAGSAFSPPLGEMVRQYGIDPYVDFILNAEETGFSKPDPAIFRQALAVGGDVPAQRAVHIGDNYYTDGIGARRAGIGVILIDGHAVFQDVAGEGITVVSALADLLPG
jgi:HAD superfamily hydrolase (TIGR01549 family)